MPICDGCGSKTTPAVINVGDGLAIQGAGTPTAPYVIDLASQSAIANFQVRDSATINFTLTGSGTDDDPYLISGDTGTAISLTGLADYSDTGLPNAGEVVTWVGSSSTGHWTSAPLPAQAAGTPATTNASNLTSGILSNDRLSGVMLDKLAGNTFAGDANSLLAPGLYRTGTGWSNGPTSSDQVVNGSLIVSAVGTSVTQMFFAQQSGVQGRMYHRTKYGASDWSLWSRMATTADLTNAVASGSVSDGTSQITYQGSVSPRPGSSYMRLVASGGIATLNIGLSTGGSDLSNQGNLFQIPQAYATGPSSSFESAAVIFDQNSNGGGPAHIYIRGRQVIFGRWWQNGNANGTLPANYFLMATMSWPIGL